MDKSTLLKNHEGSIWALLKIYNTNGALFKGKLLLFSLVVDTLFCITVTVVQIDVATLIKTLVDLYLTILPSLLGFNLGAYALLIGLASSDLLTKLSASYENRFTSFQRASSVFGFCVLLQAIALILTFLFKLGIIINEGQVIQSIAVNAYIVLTFNVLALFALNFFGIYSIIILISVLRSIFSLSQTAHFFSVTNHIKKKAIEEKPEDK